MENIEFLVHTSDLKIGEEANAIRSSFLRKASKLIENEINETGGIAGKNVVIHYTHIPYGMGHAEEIADEIIEFISNKPNIICTNGATAKASNKKIIREIDLDQIILFTGTTAGEFHPNKFLTERRSEESNVKLIAHITETLKVKSRLFYLHSGVRTASFESDFTLTDKKRVVSQKIVSKEKEEAEIKIKVMETLSSLEDDDVVILDLNNKALAVVIDYFNEIRKKTVVWSFYGSLERKYPEIAFPLRQLTTGFVFRNLDFENLIHNVDMSLTAEDKVLIGTSYSRLEYPLLLAYASENAGLTFSDKKQFLTDISKAINGIDGRNDIFIAKRNIYAFTNNAITLKDTYLYQFPSSLQTPGSFPKVFHSEQISDGSEGFSMVKVNYINIDVLRATNINIGDGTWSCEFYLDIVSPHDNPLEFINFNNLSSINPKFEAKPIWEEHVDEEEENSRRYYVVANFDFNPLADNYPFDWQHIYISFSITDQNRYGIIQPIPEILLDRDFHVDGWKLNEATTGVLRKKEVLHKGTNYTKRVEIREEARVGWTLARANSVTVMKIGIPLSFLLFLNYYTLFREFKDIGGSVGILTTAFLAGIALYFSTERPQPLRMTTVDLIFLWYYMLTGIIIVATSVSSLLGAKIFIVTVTGLKFIVPLGVIGICVFLLRRIKSNRLKPRIN